MSRSGADQLTDPFIESDINHSDGLSSKDVNEDSTLLQSQLKNNTDDLNSRIQEYEPPLPPDGGWGWAVAVASFIINIIVDGFCYTFGIFLNELVNHFETTKGKAALAGSLVPAMYLIVGPVVSALANRFGCRAVTIAGSFLSCFGFCISVISPNIEVMALTFGVLGGVGFGLMYLPSIVMVGYYFDKRRALATGFAVCGAGIGTFVFSPLASFLVDKYGWKGATIVFGGICLHGLVCALIFRPLEARRVPVAGEKSTVMRAILEEKRRRKLSTESDDGSVITGENRWSKSVDVILEAEDEEKLHDEASDKSSNQEIIVDGSLQDKTLPEKEPLNERDNALPLPKQLEIVKRLEVGVTPRTQSELSARQLETTAIDTEPVTAEDRKQIESPFVRQDIFYAGSVTTLPGFKESRDVSYVQSVTSIPAKNFDMSIQEHDTTKCSRVPKILTYMLDFSLLRSFTFIVTCLAGVFVFIGLYVPFVYIAEKAMSTGISKTNASLIVSILGAVNTLGRVVTGVIADLPSTDCLLIHNMAAIVAGVVTCLVPLFNTFELLIVYAILFGSCIAAFVALRSIVFVELLGIRRLTNSFGLTSLFQGLAVLIGSPLSGAVLDSTNSYTIPFVFSGCMIALGGLVCLPARRIASIVTENGHKVLQSVAINYMYLTHHIKGGRLKTFETHIRTNVIWMVSSAPKHQSYQTDLIKAKKL